MITYGCVTKHVDHTHMTKREQKFHFLLEKVAKVSTRYNVKVPNSIRLFENKSLYGESYFKRIVEKKIGKKKQELVSNI